MDAKWGQNGAKIGDIGAKVEVKLIRKVKAKITENRGVGTFKSLKKQQPPQ